MKKARPVRAANHYFHYLLVNDLNAEITASLTNIYSCTYICVYYTCMEYWLNRKTFLTYICKLNVCSPTKIFYLKSYSYHLWNVLHIYGPIWTIKWNVYIIMLTWQTVLVCMLLCLGILANPTGQYDLPSSESGH